MSTDVNGATPGARGFRITLAISFVWQNVSEVFHYFVLLRDRIQAAVPGLPERFGRGLG